MEKLANRWVKIACIGASVTALLIATNPFSNQNVNASLAIISLLLVLSAIPHVFRVSKKKL